MSHRSTLHSSTRIHHHTLAPKLKDIYFFSVSRHFLTTFLYNAHKFCTRIVCMCVCVCVHVRAKGFIFYLFVSFFSRISYAGLVLMLVRLDWRICCRIQCYMHVANAMWISRTFYLTSSWQFFSSVSLLSEFNRTILFESEYVAVHAYENGRCAQRPCSPWFQLSSSVKHQASLFGFAIALDQAMKLIIHHDNNMCSMYFYDF